MTIQICIVFSIIAIIGNMPLCGNPLFGPHESEDANLFGATGVCPRARARARMHVCTHADQFDAIH